MDLLEDGTSQTTDVTLPYVNDVPSRPCKYPSDSSQLVASTRSDLLADICRQDGRGDVTRRSGQREEEKDGGFCAREVTSPRTDKRWSANAGYVCVVLCEHCNNVLCVRSPWPTSPRSATFAVRISSTNLCTLPSRSGLTGFGKGKTPSFSSGAPNRLSITSDCTTPDEAQKTAAATSLHHSKKAPQLPGPSRQALTRKTAG